LQVTGTPTVLPLKVTDCMSATLSSGGPFTITSNTEIMQFIEEGGAAYWSWWVAAQVEGTHQLLLTISQRRRTDSGECTESQTSKSLLRTVTVKPGPDAAGGFKVPPNPVARSDMVSSPLLLVGLVACAVALGAAAVGLTLSRRNSRRKATAQMAQANPVSTLDSLPAPSTIQGAIANSFSMGEIDLLCADLDGGGGGGAGATPSTRALQLVEYCRRRGRYPALVKQVRQLRPQLEL
jgi:hypothetical protein